MEIRLFAKPLQLTLFRRRVFSGETLMSIDKGIENGLATAAMSPWEFAPTSQQQLRMAEMGSVLRDEGKGRRNSQSAICNAAEGTLRRLARYSTPADDQSRIWHDMLQIWADETFSIGTVAGVLQPVVVSEKLRNVPEEGFYNWDPGAFFGIFKPDDVLARYFASTQRNRRLRTPRRPCVPDDRLDTAAEIWLDRLMLSYFVHRILIMIPTLIAISIVIFTIINLPPGELFYDLHRRVAELGRACGSCQNPFFGSRNTASTGRSGSNICIGSAGLLRGDMGYSFSYNLPVTKVVGDRLLLTFLVSFTTILFTYLVAFPIGVYSATHQYSWIGLLFDVAGISRAGDTQLSVRARPGLPGECVFRDFDRRPDGSSIRRSAVDLEQDPLGARAYLDPRYRHRNGRNCEHDPAVAR